MSHKASENARCNLSEGVHEGDRPQEFGRDKEQGHGGTYATRVKQKYTPELEAQHTPVYFNHIAALLRGCRLLRRPRQRTHLQQMAVS